MDETSHSPTTKAFCRELPRTRECSSSRQKTIASHAGSVPPRGPGRVAKPSVPSPASRHALPVDACSVHVWGEVCSFLIIVL